jgi:membrane protein DedA with SNARE-associated domain
MDSRRFAAMEFLQPHLDFLARHLYALVFGAFLIEAAGIPFPSRLVLLIAATLTERIEGLAGLIGLSALGAVIGDHVPYAAGRLMGPRLLTFYCRLTLGSERCVERTVAYFVRFGAAAILLSRFSASVRIFAAVLSGCGHIAYWRFVGWDVVGSLIYATVWVSIGYLIGDEAAELLERFGGARVLLLVAPAALATLLAYRLWRRSRYGPARPIDPSAITCDSPTRKGGLHASV